MVLEPDVSGAEGDSGDLFVLNGLSIDSISINQDGELRVAFDLPVVQTTACYHQQLQGVRTFDVYKDPELEGLVRKLFQALVERVRKPDPERVKVSCSRCKSSNCCREYNVLVLPSDLPLLREGLGISDEELRARYRRPAVDWAGDYPFQLACDEDEDGEKCVFLKEGPGGQMRCSIYPYRPRICRDFDERACDDFTPLG